MLKKALIHNPYWDTLGGGERYVATFIKLLLSRNWQVDILWPNNITAAIKSRFNIDISAASYVSPDVYTSKYGLSFYVSDGSLPISFSRTTLIHFQFPFTNVRGKSLFNKLKSRNSKFICNSNFTKSFIDKEFGINSIVIYPPIDIEMFSPGTKTNSILYVGRFSQLTQLKNQDLLIKSFINIHNRIPSWKLILAGGVGIGSEDAYLNSLVGLAKELPIEIHKNPSFADLKKLYSTSSIFWAATGFGIDDHVTPTKVEHFGMSLVESMSAGCVPIVSNLGGHKEIIDNSTNGFLVQNTGALESKTLELITNSDALKKLSIAAIEKSKLYSTQSFDRSFSKLI